MVISSCLDGGFGRFGHAGAGDRTHTLHLGASYLGKKENPVLWRAAAGGLPCNTRLADLQIVISSLHAQT